MEKILVIGCNRTMDQICVGCSRCHVAFNRHKGEFSRYEETKAELLGVAGCGDCPGTTVLARLGLLKVTNAPLGDEEPTKIHLAPCLINCPHSESIVEKIRAKCEIEIIKGTHPYQMRTIFE